MKSSEIAALSKEQREEMKVRESLKGLGELAIVLRWYENPNFTLKPAEDKIRQRLDFAKAKFLEMMRYSELCEAIMAEFNVSIAQARNDIRNMKHVWGDLEGIPKAANRQRAIQMALNTYKVAEAAGDADGMAKATKVYITATGVDRDDPEQIDVAKLMAERTFVEVMDPSIRSMFLNLMTQQGGSMDLTKVFEIAYAAKTGDDEFVDYEEMPPPAESLEE